MNPNKELTITVEQYNRLTEQNRRLTAQNQAMREALEEIVNAVACGVAEEFSTSGDWYNSATAALKED